jgi:hypothetical protein
VPEKSSPKIDLSKFTAVEVPAWKGKEDWMVPDFGVITKAGAADGMMADWMFFITVCGVTKSDVENYKKTLKAHGMTTDKFEVTFNSPAVHIALGTSAVETMKDSEMYITFEKK